MVYSVRAVVLRPALKQTSPPERRVKGPRPVVQGRVHIIEEVPNMANDDPHDLVLGDDAVQDKAEAHEDPWEVRRGEHQQAEEAQPGVRIAPRPDVDERRR